MTNHNDPRAGEAGDEHELDRHILRLLSLAVADAPVPPALEATLSTTPNHPERRGNPWIIGGAVLAAAAALLLAFVIPNLGDDTITEAVDQDTTTVEPTPTSPTEPTPTEPTEPSPTEPATSQTETTNDVPAESEPASMVVIAGPEGVTLQPIDGSESSTVGNPAWIAIAGPDDRIFYQPLTEIREFQGVQAFEAVDPATGDVETIEVPNETAGTVSLHDVVDVDGELTILYVIESPQCTGLNDPLCLTTLAAYQPDIDRALTIEETNGWEFAWKLFTSSDSGLVVGSGQDLVTEIPRFFTIGSGPTITAGDVGLEDTYFDCNDCPHSFTVDRSGSYVGWIEGILDEQRLVVVDVATGEQAEQAIDVQSGYGYLRIAGIEIDNGEIVGGQASFTRFSYERDASPTLIDLASDTATTLAPGTVATLD